MDRIKASMDQLSEITDEQVSELQASILSEFESVEKEDPTTQTVDAMTSLADMLDGVRNELKRREAAATELAQRAAEATTRVYGQDDSKNEDMEATSHEETPATEEAPAAPVEEVPAVEEVPVSETPSPTMEEEKKMENAAEMPAETPEEEKTPADMEEDKKEEEEKKLMTEASTEAEKNSEFSTENQVVIEVPTEATPVAEETVVAAAVEGEATAVVEAPVVAEAAVVEAAVASQDAPVAEAVVEVVAEGSEASIQEEVQTTDNVQTAQEIMEAPVTAAADNADTNLNIEVPADRRPTSRTSAAPVAITAGADIPGYTAGSSLNDMSAVAEAMSKRLHSLRRVNGGDGEQHIVASVSTQYSEDRMLTQDAESNWNKVQAVVGPEALVAAGGHQAPFEVKYDIFGLGSAVRPVRDSLPRFQADRGGIRYITPPVLSAYPSAVGIWTAANDSAETPSPASKLSLTVVAASETTVSTDAVTLQLQFGNLMSRAYPELIARHNELGLIQHAREAEGNLLTKIAASSTAVTSTSIIGFGRDFLVQIGRAAAAYRARHRMDADAPLRAIIPNWVKDAMAADLTLNMPGDSNLNAYAEIEGYIAARGVTPTFSMDTAGGAGAFSAQSSGAMNEFPDTCVWWLFAEGSFLFLDGGTLDLGIIRDSTLVGTNDYKMFVETFENAAFVGVESLQITSTINVNGVAAALRDTLGGLTASTLEF